MQALLDGGLLFRQELGQFAVEPGILDRRLLPEDAISSLRTISNGVYPDLESWRRYAQAAGFVELTPYHVLRRAARRPALCCEDLAPCNTPLPSERPEPSGKPVCKQVSESEK
jgi:hypothetical protein